MAQSPSLLKISTKVTYMLQALSIIGIRSFILVVALPRDNSRSQLLTVFTTDSIHCMHLDFIIVFLLILLVSTLFQ